MSKRDSWEKEAEVKRELPPCLRCGRKGNYEWDSEQEMHFCVHCGLFQPMRISVRRVNWEAARLAKRMLRQGKLSASPPSRSR